MGGYRKREGRLRRSIQILCSFSHKAYCRVQEEVRWKDKLEVILRPLKITLNSWDFIL
jgi:hypothetical protein